jgi:nitrogenase molybdenum-iron protein alpha/beta subunit
MNSYLAPSRSCYLFGALRYFSVIDNTVCIVHGPVGCTFFNRSAVLRVNQPSGSRPRIPKIYCTDFNERDTIFGGLAKVSRAIEEIDARYSPDLIVVLNCCVSEVIGEDIENLVSRVQAGTKAKLLPVRGAGFRGDHKCGMKDASLLLYESFIRPHVGKVAREERTVNYLGELNPNQWTIRELQSLLQRFGINVNCVVPTNCSLSSLADVPRAAVNYVVCNSASGRLAARIEEDSGIPSVGCHVPYLGLTNSKRTLSDLLSAFHIESTIADVSAASAMEATREDREVFKSKTACVVCGTRRAVGYSALLKELGFQVRLAFAESDDDWSIRDALEGSCERAIIDDEPEMVMELVRELKPDILLTSLSSLVVPERYVLGCQDFYGFAGFVRAAKFLREKLQRYETVTLDADQVTL